MSEKSMEFVNFLWNLSDDNHKESKYYKNNKATQRSCKATVPKRDLTHCSRLKYNKDYLPFWALCTRETPKDDVFYLLLEVDGADDELEDSDNFVDCTKRPWPLFSNEWFEIMGMTVVEDVLLGLNLLLLPPTGISFFISETEDL